MNDESERIQEAFSKNRGKFRLVNVYLPIAGPFGLVLFVIAPIAAFGVIALMIVVYIWISKLSKSSRTVPGELQPKPVSRLWVTVSSLLVFAAITLFVLQAING
jgi:hypothetical protein